MTRRRTLLDEVRQRRESAGNGHAGGTAQRGGHGPTANGGASRGPVAAPEDDHAHHLTDLGNARRVVERHGADLRHCHPWKKWLTWDGQRWAEDETGEVVRRMKETQAALYRTTAEQIEQLGNVG